MARSNRQLTQFAVRKINEYLRSGPTGFQSETQGNTEVQFNDCESSDCIVRTLRVKLFNESILTLILSPANPRIPSGIVLQGGNFYDSKGRPSRTTRERLNGILDSLGELHFIPQGIRAFIDKETGECRVGAGEASRPLSADSNTVVILSNPNTLVFS